MDFEITSVKNPRIKDAMRLRDRRGRDRQQKIIIDGYRECLRALDSGISTGELFICSEHLDREQLVTIEKRVIDRQITPMQVTDEVFRKVAFGKRAEGIILTAPQPDTSLRNIRVDENPIIAVLEKVEKPGNLGAIIRTADAAGISAVIVVDGGTDLYNPNAIRASLGAIFPMPLASGTVDDTLGWLRSRQIQLLATRVDGAINYTAVDFRKPSAIILGSESLGLTDRWRELDVQAITVPMHGIVDSLNVSATAAVLFYEAVRQRSVD